MKNIVIPSAHIGTIVSVSGGVLISGISLIYAYGVNSAKRELHDTFNDKKIERLITTMDTILIAQKKQSLEFQSVKLEVDSQRAEAKCIVPILKKVVISNAKTKQDILEAVKSFGPYFNLNDTKKKSPWILYSSCLNLQE